MKKLVLMLAVAFSMSFVACGNKEAAAEETPAAEITEVETIVAENDSCCGGDSCCAAADSCCAAAAAEVVEVAE